MAWSRLVVSIFGWLRIFGLDRVPTDRPIDVCSLKLTWSLYTLRFKECQFDMRNAK